MKKRLAIINCKSKKQSYKCTAEEMYSISFQFRAQIEFIKLYYDDYAILSTKYGIIYPTSIIEPYEISLAQGARLKNTNTLSEKELDEWVNSVKSQLKLLSEIYNEIDLHISTQYLKPIEEVLNNPKIFYIKQPVNPGLVKNRYNEVFEILNNGDKVNLNSIGELRKSTNPEISRKWYHNDFKTFTGFARHLSKEYPDVDEGNASMVSKGKNLHTRGWVIDKSLLKKLYKTDSGQWRVKKP